ncbi:MAG: hypothetical protein HYT48_00870 [Candidatus Vogelbacteria bacterium]|nr:hypothetical protein [Candidatus Vogelbacteria bacterium]
MVFNPFSRGYLEVIPEKYNYSPGEVIRGTVKLGLKKTTRANKLSIWLIGQQTTTFVSPSLRFGASQKSSLPRNESQTTVFFQFELPVSGEQEYSTGEYPFEINIPANVLPVNNNNPPRSAPGLIGGVLEAATMLGGALRGSQSVRVDWTLEAILNIPSAIDMRKNVKINIG